MKIAIIALIYGAQAIRLGDEYDDRLDHQIKDAAILKKMQESGPRAMADGNYHLANGKVYDFRGNEVDTLEYDYAQLPELKEHYHIVNGELQDRDGQHPRFAQQNAQQNVQIEDVFDETYKYDKL